MGTMFANEASDHLHNSPILGEALANPPQMHVVPLAKAKLNAVRDLCALLSERRAGFALLQRAEKLYFIF